MAYKVKTLLSNRNNYGSKRNINLIKYLVFHYTANDGDTDEANANYFHNKVVKASANEFIDDDSVTISVPENYVAWAVGGSLQGKTGGMYHGKCTNTNSYSVELCDTQKNGKYDLSAKTRANAIARGKELIKKYGIKKENVLMHWHVTGKICPKYFVENLKEWEKFVDELYETKAPTKKTYSGTLPTLGKKGYLSKGDKGVNVGRLQDFLNWCINAGLKKDNSFGHAVESAVKKYQKQYKLTQDGKFGPKSLAKAKTIKKIT